MPVDRPILPALGALAAAALLLAAVAPAAGRAWLAAMFFWSGVPIGSIGFALIMRLVGGAWRPALGPSMLRGGAALPVTAVAVLPVLIGMAAIYPWVAAPPGGFKGVWLAPLPFALRTIAWIGGLAAIVALMPRGRPGVVATVGLLFFVPMGSLIAVDWLMSLDPAFHSSGFGLQALVVQFTVALMVAVLRMPPDASGTTGALMLTLLMLWSYLDYLPFFIVWSGNPPAGAAWYLARSGPLWGTVSAAAAAAHGIPLLALLSPGIRRRPVDLRRLALIVLAGDALQCAWMALPGSPPGAALAWLFYLVAVALIGVPTLLAGSRR